MGRFSQLFGLKKSTGSDAGAIPTPDKELIQAAEPWQGNLPCVHGDKDGCNYHNPGRHSVFFDPLLFPASEKPKPSGNHRSDNNSNIPGPADIFTISSSLPRSLDSGCLTLLPRVHKSVPYSLAFYHLHHLTSSLRAGSDGPLTRITCTASTGSNPRLFWTVRPILVGSSADSATLLLQYTMSFSVEADLGGWTEQTQHGRAVAKVGLIGSGYKDFSPCRHVKVSFRSHRGEGKHHVRTAGVSFSRKVDGVESKEEWRSEEDKLVAPTGCTKCYTDTYLEFQMLGPNVSTGGAVLITVTVNKDLGRGEHPSDPKWLAAAMGVDLQRDVTDLGRMRRLFEGADGDAEGDATTLRGDDAATMRTEGTEATAVEA